MDDMIRGPNTGIKQDHRGSLFLSQNHLSGDARRRPTKNKISLNPEKLLPVFCLPLASFTTAASKCLYAIRAIGVVVVML